MYVKVISDDERSMIASAFAMGCVNFEFSLCCSKDALAACTAIVGPTFAVALKEFVHSHLGCGTLIVNADGSPDGETIPIYEQRYLDDISALDTLTEIQ
jgi:hypothetical protein